MGTIRMRRGERGPPVVAGHHRDGKLPKIDEIILTLQGALPSMEE